MPIKWRPIKIVYTHIDVDAHIGLPMMAYTNKIKIKIHVLRYVRVLVCFCACVYFTFMTVRHTHRFCRMQKVNRKYCEWNLNRIKLIRKTNQCVFDFDTIHNLSFVLSFFSNTLAHCAIFMFLLGRSVYIASGWLFFLFKNLFLCSSVGVSRRSVVVAVIVKLFFYDCMLPLNGYTRQNIHIQYLEKCFRNEFLFMRKFSHEKEKNAMKIGALI